jgi:glycosyltransferase involved in cell wall biosynthesis
MRRLLLNVAPFRVSPPVAGAHHAVYYADDALSKYWDVFLFTTGVRKDTLRFPPRPTEFVISPHFRDYSYVTASILPFSFMTRQGSGVPQVYAGRYLSWVKPSVLDDKVRECDVIQVEFPWQVGYVNKINVLKKPLVLVAHNVEADLCVEAGSGGKRLRYKSRIIDNVCRKEREAVELADAVMTVSEADRERVIELYGVKEDKVFHIPWGVDTRKYCIHSEYERVEAKKKFGLSGKKVVVFSGALYEPNVEAVRFIIDLAKGYDSDTVFMVVGRVGEAFKGVSNPNVIFTGFVDNPVNYFIAADVAINPMRSGGGMHLKMLEYLASSLPTVTTELGARGFRRPWEDYMMISDMKGFSLAVRSMLEDVTLREHYGAKGRGVVEEFYTWDMVARERIRVYEGLLTSRDLGS